MQVPTSHNAIPPGFESHPVRLEENRSRKKSKPPSNSNPRSTLHRAASAVRVASRSRPPPPLAARRRSGRHHHASVRRGSSTCPRDAQPCRDSFAAAGAPAPRHPSAATVLASGAPQRIRSSLKRIGARRWRIELQAPAARAFPCAVDNSRNQQVAAWLGPQRRGRAAAWRCSGRRGPRHGPSPAGQSGGCLCRASSRRNLASAPALRISPSP